MLKIFFLIDTNAKKWTEITDLPAECISIIYTITIGAMLNLNDLNGGNNGHGLKTLRVNIP